MAGPDIRATHSGILVDPAYGPSEALPGKYPYTRGIHPTMYRGRHWTMRQYAGYASAEESNRRYRFLLEGGQTGLSVAFDLPTQLGYDPDHPLACGEVGRVGVSVASLDDMATLFDGIPVDRVSTSMTINATAPILLAFYIANALRQGIAPSTLLGTVQNDILKEYVARGTYIYPPRASLRLITDTVAYCARELPRWNPISISGYHLREAGATAVQELAFTLANGIEYVRAALSTGLDIDDFAPRLSFFFACHNEFFEEIAKFRAARRLWAETMRDQFGAKRPESWKLRFHTQTAGSTLTAQEPENNVIRVTLQALAAVMGGTQSLHCNALDEALALPTEATARTALRTQQIIAHETGVTATADPLGGSYFVEALTDEVANGARRLLAEIARIGGAMKAVETGYYSRLIEESAYQCQRSIDDGSQVIAGVNRFRSDTTVEQDAQTLLSVDSTLGAQQAGRLVTLRATRDEARVQAALTRLSEAARGSGNLMEPLIAGAQVSATLGELAGALRDVFGEYRDGMS